jgi:CPA2 family monovalent cation:H+ antiporter-2
LTFLGKAAIVGVVTRAFGYVNMAPWVVGLGLSPIGEFSFVLARTGMTSGMLSKSTYDLALTCTVLTMALSPIVTKLALPLDRAWQKWRKPTQALALVEPFCDSLEGHVVVAGYGRIGRAAARALQRAETPLAVVEISHSLFGGLESDGFSGIWGDMTGEAILKAVRIEKARIFC